MPNELWSVAIASTLATSIIILGSVRLLPRHRSLAYLRKWQKLSALQATAGLTATFLSAAALISNLEGGIAATAVTTQMPSLADFSNLPGVQAASIQDGAPGERDRALANLRDYAGRIRGKQQLIASIDSDPKSTDASATLPDVETMIGRLAKRVSQDPSNVDNVAMLGWSYVSTGKYSDGVKAYRQAIALDPSNSKLQAALAEAEKKLSSEHPEADVSSK